MFVGVLTVSENGGWLKKQTNVNRLVMGESGAQPRFLQQPEFTHERECRVAPAGQEGRRTNI